MKQLAIRSAIVLCLTNCAVTKAIQTPDQCGIDGVAVVDVGPDTCAQVALAHTAAVTALKPKLDAAVIRHDRATVVPFIAFKYDLAMDKVVDCTARDCQDGESGQTVVYPGGAAVFVDKTLQSLCHEYAHSLDIAAGNLLSAEHYGWDRPGSWYDLCASYERSHCSFPVVPHQGLPCPVLRLKSDLKQGK